MRKICLLISLVILVFLANILSSSAYSLSCSVVATNACSGVMVLNLTSDENAHVDPTGEHTICCEGVDGLGGGVMDSGAAITGAFLWLSDNTNAHVRNSSIKDYDYIAYISSPAPINCTYGPSCGSTYTCLASISAEINAQIAKCNYYTTQICCREQLLRYTWDNKEYGWCPEQSQCLVNPGGNSANNNDPSKYDYSGDPEFDDPTSSANSDDNPICINNTQYIGDHYCENGNWTTRTKLLAVQLLNLTEGSYAPNDYVLFCDEYDKVLNYYDYRIKIPPVTNNRIDEYFIKQDGGCKIEGVEVPCVNKVCILKYKKDSDDYNVVFGASLNQPIDSARFSFLEALNKLNNYCNGALTYNDNQFHSCSGNDTNEYDIWYNPELQLVVYAKDQVRLTPLTFWENFVSFIRTPFSSIFNTIVNIIIPRYPGGPEVDYNFINKTSNFDKLYLNNKDQNIIRGVTEKIADDEFLAITYTGFSEDICESVDIYNREIATAPEIINCNETSSIYYVETKKFIGQAKSMLDNWYDLTAKLRVE